MPENRTIAVAMSGGVDSSTAAGLLQRAGHRIIGLTMQLWDRRRLPRLSGGAAGRPLPDHIQDARRVAEHLGIPHHVVNLEKRFEEEVVRPFIEEYLAGRTPIPCVLCNQLIKFGRLLAVAGDAGAERIATGHYARVAREEATGRHLLRRGVDSAKDQTYFLLGLRQEQLARTLFPLGGMTKVEVRDVAKQMHLPVAEKEESQEICFVPGGDYAAFMDAYCEEQGIPARQVRGEIVTSGGRVIGHHEGVHRFTIGQRRGLGVATGEPLYVIAIDPATGRVVVGPNEDLLRDRLVVAGVNWIAFEKLAEPVRAEVKIRNKHDAAPATVCPTGDPARVEVRFDAPQRAVTPGQAAVFYRGDLVLGGGWIER